MTAGSKMLHARPVLIYDNYCVACTRFAKTSVTLSRNRIYAVGHYTAEGMRIKSRIFPKRVDAESMFWLVGDRKAFGGRSGLLPLAREIVKGMFGVGEKVPARSEGAEEEVACDIESMPCSTPRGLFSRVYGLLRNGKKVERVDGR
ncbi:MAG: hypothetical protein ACE5JV_03530 [Nitrososphaerales archaeon]